MAVTSFPLIKRYKLLCRTYSLILIQLFLIPVCIRRRQQQPAAAAEEDEDEDEELRHGRRYVRMPAEPEGASSASFRLPESARVFDELPRARIVGVSRPDAGDITPMLLSYTIEVQYKQVRVLILLLLVEIWGLYFRCVVVDARFGDVGWIGRRPWCLALAV